MTERIRAIFAREGITELGFLPFRETRVLNARLLPPGMESVLVLLAPYDCGEPFADGVSAYAHVEDYHRFFDGLFARTLPDLREAFPGHAFYGFADHSPLDEKDAAAKAGLGVLGCHSLLLHPRYGSYFFLGSVLTDLALPCEAHPVRTCEACGKCLSACPVGAVTETGIRAELCLSALSQKKRLTEEERRLLTEHGVAWGCDRCQEVCPYNRDREPTPIPYFRDRRHGDFTADEVEKMDDETFSRFAFSWRGRTRIVENLRDREQSLAQSGQKEKNSKFIP